MQFIRLKTVILFIIFASSFIASLDAEALRQRPRPHRGMFGAESMFMTINTANTSGGSTSSTQFQLPLVSGATYNFIVDWGDNTQSTITAWNDTAKTHTSPFVFLSRTI
jgi:predicted permease